MDREKEATMPINQIINKPFYQIPIKEINPYQNRKLLATIYVTGSPGSGKSRLLNRLKDETGGKLVIESGVFDLFQKHVTEYVYNKQLEGEKTEVDFSDLDFDMPHIDGLCVHDNFMGGLEHNATVNNAPYSGIGACHYRDFLSDINSGGKSGYPDWLFVPILDYMYIQLISFPGHRNIANSISNKSIPQIPNPTSAIYLVDPDIQAYHHEDWMEGHQNPPLNACNMHLSDILELENQGINTHWFLSKTISTKVEENKNKTMQIYNKENLREIVRRIPTMDYFDSFESSREEIYSKIGSIIGLH